MTFRTVIVTPTYNERDNLDAFLAGVHDFLPDADVLIVDDASPDGTGEYAEDRAKQDKRLSVLHRPGKLGLGSAYREGFRMVLDKGYEVVIQMDTDLSHDPCYLPRFLQAMRDGADVVIGSRNISGGGVEGWGLGRHVLSKGGSLYSRTILALPVHDLTSGYKAFHRRVLTTIDLAAIRSEGYSFQIEMTYRAIRKGFRVVEIPIRFVDRRVGKSKMSRKIFAEAVGMVWKLRWDALRHRL